MHSLTTFLLGLYFSARNIFTVSVTSACARAIYPEKSMTTATGSWIVFGELLLNIFFSLLELLKTMLHFFKTVYFRGCTRLFRASSIPQPDVSQQNVFSAGWEISETAESSGGNKQPQWYTYILISYGRMAQNSEVWIPILLLIYLNKIQFQQSKCKLTNTDYTECYNIECIQKLLQLILLPTIHLFYFRIIN